MSKTFQGLTPAQDRVLAQIATGNDGAHHPATLKALEDKGLIESEEVKDNYGGLPFTYRRYYVPFPIHLEWCEWCASQP